MLAAEMNHTASTTIEPVRRENELLTLWRDDRAGVRFPAGAAHAGARMHRCQRGNISLLVLFMGLVFYALAAMAWNTGEVTTAKIEAQTAADSAAYSSAVWTSRAINVVAATNAIALRDASALGVAAAVIFEGIWVIGWDIFYFVSKVVPLFPGLPWSAPAIAALLAPLAQDLIQFGRFVSATGWPVDPVADIIKLGKHLNEIMRYQGEWIAVLPGLIATQTAEIENYFDCDIKLLRGDGLDQIAPPLHPGSPVTCVVPITARFAYDSLMAESWYQDDILKLIVIGKGKTGWLIGSALGYIGSVLGLGFSHHVLSSQPWYSPLEFGPYGTGFTTGPETWAQFTVVASAQKRTSNVASGQLPRFPLRFMAPGIFDDQGPLQPVAYAQAETYNGIDGLISTVEVLGVRPLQLVFSIYPWRVWTDWGWQWQPRLTHGSLVPRELFQGTLVNLPGFGPNFRKYVTTH